MKKLSILMLCCALSVSVALADGDGPTRNMNSSEAAAFNSLQNSIRAALPQPPSNYSVTYTGFDNREIFQAITPEQMHRMSFKVLYTLKPEVQASMQQAALMDTIKGTPAQQARREALAAKAEELKSARKSARSRDEKERIRAELKKINAEDNALTDEIAANAGSNMTGRLQEMDKTLPAKELSVRVLVNQDVHVYDGAKPYQVDGSSLAFAQSEQCQDSGTYCITVLFGAFDKEKRISGSTRYNLRNTKLGVPTKPRGMALIVAGPRDRPESAQNLLKRINIPKLKALVP